MRTVTALSLAALALSGAACGTSSGQLEGASEAAPTTPDQVRTVQTPYGAQAVPLEPQRIVTLEGRRDFETMVALGLTPVAAGYQGDRDQPFARFIDADVDDVQLAFPANNEDLEVLAGLATPTPSRPAPTPSCCRPPPISTASTPSATPTIPVWRP